MNSQRRHNNTNRVNTIAPRDSNTAVDNTIVILQENNNIENPSINKTIGSIEGGRHTDILGGSHDDILGRSPYNANNAPKSFYLYSQIFCNIKQKGLTHADRFKKKKLEERKENKARCGGGARG